MNPKSRSRSIELCKHWQLGEGGSEAVHSLPPTIPDPYPRLSRQSTPQSSFPDPGGGKGGLLEDKALLPLTVPPAILLLPHTLGKPPWL